MVVSVLSKSILSVVYILPQIPFLINLKIKKANQLIGCVLIS